MRKYIRSERSGLWLRRVWLSVRSGQQQQQAKQHERRTHELQSAVVTQSNMRCDEKKREKRLHFSLSFFLDSRIQPHLSIPRFCMYSGVGVSCKKEKLLGTQLMRHWKVDTFNPSLPHLMPCLQWEGNSSLFSIIRLLVSVSSHSHIHLLSHTHDQSTYECVNRARKVKSGRLIRDEWLAVVWLDPDG